MAFADGECNPPAFSVGVDVMRVKIPGRETFHDFIQTVGDQLTSLEYRILSTTDSLDEGLSHFFWIWTMKEAYTKALGIGMGFDFRRVEYHVLDNTLTVDGRVPKGWDFVKFEFHLGEDLYHGVAAQYTGGDQTIIRTQPPSEGWLSTYDASLLVRHAIQVFN